MTEQGGALAGLRVALAAYEAVAERYNIAFGAEDWWGTPAGQALDAELAAVEARIGRLVRFVRAMDAWWLAYTDDDVLGDRYVQASDEVKEARAALTDEDLRGAVSPAARFNVSTPSPAPETGS